MSDIVELGGFDEIADRAVKATGNPGADEEMEDAASKSERIMRPSMAVSMFRGRHHIAANVDPGKMDEEEPLTIEAMDIKPLEAEADAEPAETLKEIGVDPTMMWKADVLRALRAASDGSLSVTELSSHASNPVPGSSYSQQIQEHLVDRHLAKWVVENETVQLVTA